MLGLPLVDYLYGKVDVIHTSFHVCMFNLYAINTSHRVRQVSLLENFSGFLPILELTNLGDPPW
jgi:hypothetical protein